MPPCSLVSFHVPASSAELLSHTSTTPLTSPPPWLYPRRRHTHIPVRVCTAAAAPPSLYTLPACSTRLIRAICRPAHGHRRPTAAAEQSRKCLYVCQVHCLPTQASLARTSPRKHWTARARPQPQQVRPTDLIFRTTTAIAALPVARTPSEPSNPQLRFMENSQALSACLCARSRWLPQTSRANTTWHIASVHAASLADARHHAGSALSPRSSRAHCGCGSVGRSERLHFSRLKPPRSHLSCDGKTAPQPLIPVHPIIRADGTAWASEQMPL